MAEIPVVSLDFRWQKQVESARQAFERGRYEEAVEKASPVLIEHAACLSVRRLLRNAQVKQGIAEPGFFGKWVASLTGAAVALRQSSKIEQDPLGALRTADKLWIKDPANYEAWVVVGRAAAALDWHETAVFAFECAREKFPDRADVLAGLGRALLSAERAADAVKVATHWLKVEPHSAEAQALLRNTSVAVTVAKGKWEGAGDYRSKLLDEQRAVALEQAAKKFGKPGPPKAS